MDASEFISGDYLNSDTARDGEIAEITGEGSAVEIQKLGKTKRVFNLPVRIGKRELIYSPGFKAMRLFGQAWGTETKKWVGRKFCVKVKEVEVAGKDMRVIRPEVIA